MIDCNNNDVTQASKDFIDNLEEGLIKSERQFENCDKCKQNYHEDKIKVLEKIIAEVCDIDDEIVLNPNSFYNSKVYVRFSKVIDIIYKYKEESEVEE